MILLSSVSHFMFLCHVFFIIDYDNLLVCSLLVKMWLGFCIIIFFIVDPVYIYILVCDVNDCRSILRCLPEFKDHLINAIKEEF